MVGEGVGDNVGVIDGNGVDDSSAVGSGLGEIVAVCEIVSGSALGGSAQAEMRRIRITQIDFLKNIQSPSNFPSPQNILHPQLFSAYHKMVLGLIKSAIPGRLGNFIIYHLFSRSKKADKVAIILSLIHISEPTRPY